MKDTDRAAAGGGTDLSEVEQRQMIAPRPDVAHPPLEVLTEMMAGIHGEGTEYGYYNLRLRCRWQNVWEVYRDGEHVETLNLSAFKSSLELRNQLDEIRFE